MTERKIQAPLEDHLQAPNIRTDRHVSASYITLTDNPIVETKQPHPSVLLDVDESGDLVGVEIFGDGFIDLMEQIYGERETRDGRGRASEAY